MKSVHLWPNQFEYPSRILKHCRTILDKNLVSNVEILSISEFNKDTQKELRKNVTVVEFNCLMQWGKRSRNMRVIILCLFYLKAIKHVFRERYSFVNARSVSVLPLGVLIRWVTGATLIYDAHELESETFGKGRLGRLVSKLIELFCIHQAESVIVVSKGIEQWYRKTYKLKNVTTILNCPYYRERQKTNSLSQALKIPRDKKILLYHGIVGEGRGIEALLEVFSGQAIRNYVFVVMGYGRLVDTVKKYAQTHDNIFFKEAESPEILLEYTCSADVGIAYIDNPSLNDQYCLPNKFFEYLMARLPVVVNDTPEMAKIVFEEKIGVVLRQLKAETLNEALEHLENQEQVSLAARIDSAACRYSWEKQASCLLNVYEYIGKCKTKIYENDVEPNGVVLWPGDIACSSRIARETTHIVNVGLATHVSIYSIGNESGLPLWVLPKIQHEVFKSDKNTSQNKRNTYSRIFVLAQYYIWVLKKTSGKRFRYISPHSVSVLPLAFILAALRQRCPILYSPHELESETHGKSPFLKTLAKNIERVFIKHCDGVVVVNKVIADWYKSTYQIRRVYSITNSVQNAPTLDRLSGRKHFVGIRKEQKVLLYVGLLAEGRGLRGILKAFIDADIDDWVLVFIGFGELQAEIASWEKTFKNVRYYGPVPQSEIGSIIQGASVGLAWFDSPATSVRYSLPNKLFQYASAGIPCIVNKTPIMSEIKKKHNICFIIEEMNARSLTDALKSLERDCQKNLLSDIQEFSRRNDWRAQGSILEAVYKQALNVR